MGTPANVHVVAAEDPAWIVRLHASSDGHVGDLVLHACALPMLVAGLGSVGIGGPFGWQWDLLTRKASESVLDARMIASLDLFDTAPESVAAWLVGTRFNKLFPVPDLKDARDQYDADRPDVVVDVDDSTLPLLTVRCADPDAFAEARRMADLLGDLSRDLPGAGWRFAEGKASYRFDLTVAALAIRAANGRDPLQSPARGVVARLMGSQRRS